MPDALTVAAAQPSCRPGDLAANAAAHADTVRQARARVLVFPEMSLTGYVLDADPVRHDDPALAPVVAACADTGTIALVGAPTVRHGDRRISTLLIGQGPARVAYDKTWLGGAEPDHFTPGDGPVVLTVDGWRLGLAICKDTGSAQHTAGTAALDVDAYLAGVVHGPDELAEQEARGTVIARACRAYVVIAGAAGAVGPDYPATCGTSTIWAPTGLALTRTGRDTGDIARATLYRER